MSTNLQILLLILFCIALIAVITVTAVMLAKKKINATNLLAKMDTGMGYALSVAEAIKPFLPGYTGTVIELVFKYADEAVKQVEATYKAALITGSAANDTRTAQAKSLIQSALSLQGIQETEQIDRLIDAVIPILVLSLPKTHTEDISPKSVS